MCEEDRIKMLEQLPREGWRELSRKEFNHITVVLVEKGGSRNQPLSRARERNQQRALTETPASPAARTIPGS
jgi:hypothetical protein